MIMKMRILLLILSYLTLKPQTSKILEYSKCLSLQVVHCSKSGSCLVFYKKFRSAHSHKFATRFVIVIFVVHVLINLVHIQNLPISA